MSSLPKTGAAEPQQQGDSASARERRLREGLSAGGVGAWVYTGSGMDWACATFGSHFMEALAREDRQNFEQAAAQALAEGKPISAEYCVRDRDGGESWIAIRGACRKDGDGPFLTGVIIDVAEFHQREERLRGLTSELIHRTKNILSSIGALAGQTAKEGDEFDRYVSHLRGRIRAFAIVHEILSRSGWKGAPLKDLIRECILAASEGDEPEVHLEGPELLVKPRAAQMLGLALHELAANSAKFGVLSSGQGAISVDWQWLGGEGFVLLDWTETGVALAGANPAKGFGRVVIEELLHQDLDAEVCYKLRENEVRCSINLPSQWIAD